jgi:hypothetical protein
MFLTRRRAMLAVGKQQGWRQKRDIECIKGDKRMRDIFNAALKIARNCNFETWM